MVSNGVYCFLGPTVSLHRYLPLEKLVTEALQPLALEKPLDWDWYRPKTGRLFPF